GHLEFPHPMATATGAGLAKSVLYVLPAIPGGDDTIVPARAPVLDQHGTVVGFLLVEISVRSVAPQLPVLRLGRTGSATVVDHDGGVLLAGAHERRGGAFGAAGVVRQVAAGREGTVRYQAPQLHRKEIAWVTPVAGQPWSVVVSLADAEAYGPVRSLSQSLGIAIVGTILIGLLLAVAVFRKLHTYEIGRTRAEEELRHQALHDLLTGLPNRSLLDAHVGQAIRAAIRDGESIGLLLMDLDHFKEINDTLGHKVGDVVLCEVGRRLRGAVRESDVVARLGGDEFAIVVPGLSRADAAGVATKVLDTLERPFAVEETTLRLGGRIGVA